MVTLYVRVTYDKPISTVVVNVGLSALLRGQVPADAADAPPPSSTSYCLHQTERGCLCRVRGEFDTDILFAYIFTSCVYAQI